jgi:glycosyltransferase 2 family protein
VKKLLITLLKVAISAAIIAYLVYDATQTKNEEEGNIFIKLLNQSKRWDLLVAAWACCSGAVLLTFIRWWFLVRALGMPFRFADSIRISFWGYLFNLAPLGIVGGDLVKVVMLDHQLPHHRAKALASVLADRVIGLYILFVLASLAILWTRYWETPIPYVPAICNFTFLVTILSTVGLAMVMIPGTTKGKVTHILGRIPRVGKLLEDMINAVRMYSHNPRVLILSVVMTFGVHSLFAIGCYLIACGLFDANFSNLSLSRHFAVMPLSAALQVIPVPIGPTEAALNYLYPSVRIAGPIITKGHGLLVALAYRLITLLIAALGIFYYFGNRREMSEVIHEAEREETAGN